MIHLNTISRKPPGLFIIKVEKSFVSVPMIGLRFNLTRRHGESRFDGREPLPFDVNDGPSDGSNRPSVRCGSSSTGGDSSYVLPSDGSDGPSVGYSSSSAHGD